MLHACRSVPTIGRLCLHECCIPVPPLVEYKQVKNKCHNCYPCRIIFWLIYIHIYLTIPIIISDLIEDDVGVNQIEEKEIMMQEQQIQTNGIDTYRDLNSALVGSDKMEKTDSGLQLSSKYTDLVRQQMSNSDKNEALDAVFASGDALRTPLLSDNSAHSSQRHTPVSGLTDDVCRTPIFSDHSAHSSHRHTPISSEMQEPVRVEDVSRVPMISEQFQGPPLQRDDLMLPGRRTPTSSGRSPHSSARQSPQPELIEDILLGESSAVHASHAAQKTQVPSAELIDDVLERVSNHSEHSVHSSARQTPIVEDAMQKSWSSTTSSSSSSRTPSSRPSSSQSSASSSSHPVSQRDLISDAYRVSRERLSNRQDRCNSGSSSKTSSASGSRPPSITSEQELSQYFDHDKGHRTGTTLPVIPGLVEQSSRLMSEPYQKTYSNRPSSSTSSKSSSRTITPVMTNGLQNGHRTVSRQPNL